MTIPLSAPDIGEQDIEAVAAVLRTPHLSLGPKLEEFEFSLANYLGVSHAIAVSSGTAGLHLCLRALEISEGDEVIVPSFTFIAVANAVRYQRATPIFVDIDLTSPNLNADLLEEAITARTKAIVAVHTFGIPAELDRILEIARRHNLFVIEDACEAIGAEYNGQKIGTFGHAAVFGFYPNKQITTGEGGAVVTNNTALAATVRQLRNQGRNGSNDWFQHSELGYNYRLSDINCALGVEQLKRLDPILVRRESIAKIYNSALAGFAAFVLPPLELPQRRISWFVYVLQLNDRMDVQCRDWIVREMKSRGIATGRYFAPIHLQPIYKSYPGRTVSLPVTESRASRSLALPFFNRIRDEEIREVADALVELIPRFTGRNP
jgi:perosamine synthetase